MMGLPGGAPAPWAVPMFGYPAFAVADEAALMANGGAPLGQDKEAGLMMDPAQAAYWAPVGHVGADDFGAMGGHGFPLDGDAHDMPQ